MSGLRWRRLGKLFDPSVHPLPRGCVGWAQSPQALEVDGGLRLFFSTRSVDAAGKYVSHVASVDMTGDLSRIVRVGAQPVIAPGALGCFDEHGIFPLNVLRVGRLVFGYTCGWSRRKSVSVETAIGLAISHDDGQSFERTGPGPIMGASLREPFLVGDAFVRVFAGAFHMWYIFGTEWRRSSATAAPDRTYKIGHATSPDGRRWKREEGVRIIPDALGPQESQALPTVIQVGGRFHMLFCFRESFDFRATAGRGYRLGYASSTDLKRWTRDDSQAPPLGPAGSWDSEMMCYPHLVESGGRVFALYNGNEFGKHGFGAAVLDA